ncbi:inner-membrane translocator [Streptomyces sp. NPDC006270]|uniref:inner-membrane translocator n=1 Tax=Streptomyces sp. NPDC006270 TaxID=3364741 RepID=UPI00368C121F
MPELTDHQSSGAERALTAGCLLLLVLIADVAAALLVVIVLAVRGLGRVGAGAGQATAGVPPSGWEPVLGFGGLALAVGVTAVVLLWIGNRVAGAVQLTLSVFLAVYTLGFWL